MNVAVCAVRPSIVSTAGIEALINGKWSLAKGFSEVSTASVVLMAAASARSSIKLCDTAAPSSSTVGTDVFKVPIMSILITALIRARSTDVREASVLETSV